MIDTTIPQISAAHCIQAERWDALCNFLRQWFYEPDLEALAVALAACRAHFYEQCLAVWIMVVAPSGSGKTAIVIDALQSIPTAVELGDLTPQTLISGKKGAPSLLFEGGPNHVFLFKDFTSFLSKRKEDRRSIAAQLREIHDGRFAKNTGERGGQRWKGKVTVIAAATYAVEEYWRLNSHLGERFVTVRWPEAEDPMAVAEAADRQAGHETEIRTTLRSLTQQFFEEPRPSRPPDLPKDMVKRINALASLAARCRTHVSRLEGRHEVEEAHPTESPTRLAKAMRLTVSGWADLMERPVEEEDFELARRIALDSIPQRRARVLAAIPPNRSISHAEIQSNVAPMPASTLTYILSEMKVCRILRQDRETEQYTFEERVLQWLQLGGLRAGSAASQEPEPEE